MKLSDFKTAARLPLAFYADLAALRSTDVFIDVGANVGVITRVAHMFSRCRILAVEPNPAVLDQLLQVQKSHPRVSVFPVALGSESKNANLYLHENSLGNEIAFSEGASLRVDKVNVSATNSVQVDVLDVCEFLEEVTADRILIKIDVEGAEIDILGRLAQWDGLGRIRRIWCETHENRFEGTSYGEQLEEVKRALSAVVKVNYEWH